MIAKLDLGLEWSAEYVTPGTPYVDEPNVNVPPGWYVYGRKPGADPDEGAEHVVNVSDFGWLDANDQVVDKQLAELFAAALNGATKR